MKEIKRDTYLDKLISLKDVNIIKIITGIRRCGKSYLLFEQYYDYLLSVGIKKSNIIKISLEDEENGHLLEAKALGLYIRGKVKSNEKYYILLDEIQLVPNFEKVLNGLDKLKNLDIYVTGSNSKFLSTDIITEFRGRGYEVRINPLSFSEFFSAFAGTKEEAWNEYLNYGGLPMILSYKTEEEKSNYLTSIFENVYFKDIIDRNKLQKDDILEATVDMLASAVGSLTNPTKLANTFNSNEHKDVSKNTIKSYIDYLLNSFMISKVERYDVKGKKYISTPSKYYFADIGLRNARLNFRQQEENHLMENVIYNELITRGYNVDVGVVEYNTTEEEGKKVRKQLEVDFVCNQGSKRYYIQSALTVSSEEKMEQEQNSLIRIDDSFKKIIVQKDSTKLWRNEQGIVIIGLLEFLLNKDSLDL